MRKKLKLVCGVGLNDSKSPVKIDGKCTYEYKLWVSMLRRCYTEKVIQRHPTYINCSVEDSLLSFNNFRSFISSCVGYRCLDENGRLFQMDKDVLREGEKCYSPDTICFIPTEVNLFLTLRENKRGDLPIGVYYSKRDKKYKSQISRSGKVSGLGHFNTPEEAFRAYKIAKEDQAKVLAEKWKGKIDDRVYLALYNYELNIDD